MANRVAACIVNGKMSPVPDGDNIVDAGGNSLSAGTLPTVSTIDCSTNPNYPAADAGDKYKVTVAGKIGGASGETVEAGDVIECFVDSSAEGDHATVGSNWAILNENIVDSLAAVRKKYTFSMKFYLDGQNQLTAAMPIDFTCPVTGEITEHSVKMESARTAGSIAFTPHVNGTAFPTYTGLNLTIDATNTTSDSATVAYDADDETAVSAGDSIGTYITTSSFTPLSNSGTITIVVEG